VFNNGLKLKELRGVSFVGTSFITLTSIVLFFVSVVTWMFFNTASIGSKKYDFERTVSRLVDEIDNQVETTTNLLYSIKGEMAEEGQDYSGWREFLNYSDLEKRFPGVFSLGFAEDVDSNSVQQFENRLRQDEQMSQEYKNYFVFPKTDSEILYPIKYLHTTDRDINILLGFDLSQSEEINDALKESIETDQPTMTELISLKTIIPSSNQKGYLLILPVYLGRVEEIPTDERAKYLKGFVAAWLNPEMLMRNIENEKIQIEMFDGQTRVYGKELIGREVTRYEVVQKIKIFNKEFSVNFAATQKFKLGFFEENLPVFAFAVAVLVNGMWYLSVFMITSSQRSAVKWAAAATADLVKFKEAVDGVSDHVIITNAAGVIIYANKAAEKTTGYPVNELIGRTPSVWGKQMPIEFYRKFWEIVKTDKQPFVGQLINKRKSGEIYDAELSASPILDESGEVEYIVGIERDITKQKAIAKMKTEFISLASHQLRTPLSAVKWFGKMLSDGDAGKLSNLQLEYVQKINESNEREIKLINSLLNVSRIESGKILIDPKPADIKLLAEGVVSEVKAGLGITSKVITSEIDDDIPEMMVDGDLLRHVYINLLTNAVRYTGDDGKITLRVFVRAGDLVSEISDNGIGIPFEERGRVFEKFFRASNATKKETDGNGLGLYLAKSIVESSGGKIGFTTEDNRGTSFWFILPLTGIQKKSGSLRMV